VVDGRVAGDHQRKRGGERRVCGKRQHGRGELGPVDDDYLSSLPCQVPEDSGRVRVGVLVYDDFDAQLVAQLGDLLRLVLVEPAVVGGAREGVADGRDLERGCVA